MSKLIESLSQWLQTHFLDEKWLLVPNRRIGIQMVDHVSLTGCACVNLHIKTFPALLMDFMGEDLRQSGLRWLDVTGASLLLEQLWHQNPPSAYLSNLQTTPELFQTLFRTFESIRFSGLSHNHLDRTHFEVPIKGKELISLYQAYEEALSQHNLIDYAGILHRCLKQEPWKTYEVFWLMPEDRLLNPLEKKLWQSLPPKKRATLPVDPIKTGPAPSQQTFSQIESLGWLPSPTNAPITKDDGTVHFFRAIGESNEVREVFRRCLTQAEKLDQIEILYSDRETYLPLFYEIAQDIALPDENQSLPLTFADGIPARYAKPGRALMAWVDWIQNNYPQSKLIPMLRERLIQLPQDLPAPWHNHDKLANLLRSMPIGFGGKPRYLEILDTQRRGYENQLQEKLHPLEEDDDFDEEQYKQSIQNKINGIHALTQLIQTLFDHSLFNHSSNEPILDQAQDFLQNLTSCSTELDNYTRGKFFDEITTLREWLHFTPENTSLDIWHWLSQLPLRTQVMGSGPRPGHLHIANLYSGGYSGRPHTYITGLDDSRFPGGAVQDPLLLDKERARLSPDLPPSQQKVQEKLHLFHHLIARLRGQLTLSYSCYDLIDDRELFPANAFLTAYRILSGNPGGSHCDLIQWLEPPAAFAPRKEESCLNESQWWLWRFCHQDQPKNPRELLAFRYPHLKDGFIAQSLRDSETFTPFDGSITQAGEILSPKKTTGLTMSASSFENLGKCPLRFFFRYALGIKPPEELTIEPDRWLDHAAYGSLLHHVFEEFYSQLVNQGELPAYNRHYSLLHEILDRHIDENRRRYPPPSEEAFHRQREEFYEAINIFLKDEEEFCKTSYPQQLEAEIGMEKDNPWWIRFPDGSEIKVRGRLDRLDRLDPQKDLFALWDYKTGRPYSHVDKDPFRQGRLLQHILYLLMTNRWIKIHYSPQAEVLRFGFFFPSIRGEGERLCWNQEMLQDGQTILAALTSLIDSGSFPATDDKQDCLYCDYQTICGDLQQTVLRSQKKLLNPKNTTLEPFAKLREKSS